PSRWCDGGTRAPSSDGPRRSPRARAGRSGSCSTRGWPATAHAAPHSPRSGCSRRGASRGGSRWIEARRAASPSSRPAARRARRGSGRGLQVARSRRARGRGPGGAPMTGRWRALLRLLAVQGTWNYERMLGVGMGYAAEPLLEDLKTVDPVRHGEAVVRSAEFFNCNPNLAGLALGATARAEYEDVPGPQIVRLRTALCSPLGALGDDLFWAGLVPALVGATLAA